MRKYSKEWGGESQEESLENKEEEELEVRDQRADVRQRCSTL
jgi:hypothetical protein